MKKISILFILLCCTGVSIFAQCDLTTKKGDFDTVATISTQKIELVNTMLGSILTKKNTWHADFYFVAREKKLYIAILHSAKWLSSSIDFLNIKLDSNKIIRLDKPLKYEGYNGIGGWKYQKTEFEISIEQLNNFTKTIVSKVQFQFEYYPDSPVNEKELNSSKATKIRESASCLLNEINK
jgi:hypothetical protein